MGDKLKQIMEGKVPAAPFPRYTVHPPVSSGSNRHGEAHIVVSNAAFHIGFLEWLLPKQVRWRVIHGYIVGRYNQGKRKNRTNWNWYGVYGMSQRGNKVETKQHKHTHKL